MPFRDDVVGELSGLFIEKIAQTIASFVDDKFRSFSEFEELSDTISMCSWSHQDEIGFPDFGEIEEFKKKSSSKGKFLVCKSISEEETPITIWFHDEYEDARTKMFQLLKESGANECWYLFEDTAIVGVDYLPEPSSVTNEFCSEDVSCVIMILKVTNNERYTLPFFVEDQIL